MELEGLDRIDSGHCSSSSPSSPQKPMSVATEEEDLFSTKYSPMAFTVDFGTDTKTLDLTASISKYAPTRHLLLRSKSRKDGSESGSGRNDTPSSSHSHTESERVFGPKPKSNKTQIKDDHDDGKSETGTYTVGLEELHKKDKAIFEHIENPLDSSLEWVREWAERASTQIEHNPQRNDRNLFDRDDEPEKIHYPSRESSLNRKHFRNSWHHEESSRVSPSPSPSRLGRQYVSNYVPYGKPRPQAHAPLSFSASCDTPPPSAIPTRRKETSRDRLSADYSSPTTSGGATAGTTSPNSNSSTFSRDDGGRFSLRASKQKGTTQARQAQAPQPPPPSPAPTPTVTRLASNPRSVATVAPNTKQGIIPVSKKPVPDGPTKTVLSRKPMLSSAKRANSTLTAKEVELQNWNRRKSYDPRKAAALGKNCKGKLTPPPEPEPGQRNNPDGAAASVMTKSPSTFYNGNNAEYHLESSTEELGIGSEDEFYDSPRAGSLSRMRYRYEEPQYSHHIPSPVKQKPKFEALDCLVISTINSLSNKVRSSARNLLEKIQVQSVDDENGALVEEMIAQLKELEVTSPQKGPSRELSGTLKNLKKIEQVILVLDRILCSEVDEL